MSMAPPERPDLRPRDVRTSRAPRRRGHHRLEWSALAGRDRITFAYFFPCGRCSVCLQDELGSCPRKARANRVAGTPPYFNNAYGDYYYLRPNHYVYKLPDEISDDIATPVNCALSQVLYGLQRAGLRRSGQQSSRELAALGSMPSPSPRIWVPTKSSSSTRSLAVLS